jgi:hypothetical protein
MSQSLNLSGRRSPMMPLERSPSGRKSPNYLSHDLPGFQEERKSPTGRRSPLGFSQSFGMSISPTNGRSPAKEMVIQCWNERQKSPTSSIHHIDRKSPVGTQTQTLGIGNFYLETRRSPINQLPIPPITISNPSETCGLSPKSVDSGRMSPYRLPSPKDPSPAKDEPSEKSEKSEKKEKTSVMREILAFVRKPSKKASTRTNRFAAAFSKSDNDSNAPLVRQSTFSSSPNTSSRAGRAAVTKQMSYEPKISTKLKNVGSKMSLRLRRATESKSKDKKSSGDEISDMESSDGGKLDSASRSIYQCGTSGSVASGDNTFELEIVHFEKVGQGHKKHEQIVEEESPNQEGFNDGASTSRNELDKPRTLYEELKRSIETLFENKEPIYENIEDFKRVEPKGDETVDDVVILKTTIQCPTFEIEPPSRRASFDPPRSPFLENFRSLSDTDHDIPSGESFEVFESHRRESSFEDRHSSMDTSFDISRYQSTSYDDQTSSFEIVDSHFSDTQTQQPTLTVVKEDTLRSSSIDLSKSSIEIVDVETFQKSSPGAGRKSSLETHFDVSEKYKSDTSLKSAFASTNKSHECFPIGMKAAHQASLHHHHIPQHHPHSRTKSPILSNQTSSNYSSRDSRDDSSSTYEPIPHSHSHTPQLFDAKSPFSDLSKHHYPLPRKYSHDKTFLCIDKRCASIFEPRNDSPQRTKVEKTKTNNQLLSTTDTSSGSEFEGPSPRRALSASPKHTFTFRIVMKKVESSPEDLCIGGDERHGSRHQRERERLRRDSRRRKSRLDSGKGKSF